MKRSTHDTQRHGNSEPQKKAVKPKSVSHYGAKALVCAKRKHPQDGDWK
ncbi:hypothetical protein SKA34_16053 [Photobacterium sp. SKA34]|nr:hypothetical protein SKA34_16053 [Photobacterium sp. SKA34]